MIEKSQFPPSFWWEIHNHFGEQMFMDLTYDGEFEKQYHDNHITIIITFVDFTDKVIRSTSGIEDIYIRLRVTIKNWKTKLSFSKSDIYSMSNIINDLYYKVNQDGGDSRNILNDWVELKKPEIRDIKLSKLGI